MIKFVCLYLLIICPFILRGQQITLTHTGTQYDALENPVQKGFKVNQSRKYSVGVIPFSNLYIFSDGDGENFLKKILFDKTIGSTNFNSIGQGKTTYVNAKADVSVLNLRILKTLKYSREFGISLQFKDELNVNITNETLVLIDDFNKFSNKSLTNILNNKGFNQSYWQLGMSYRENYNSIWGFGAKFSILSGANYSNIDVYASQLQLNDDRSITTTLGGNYISSIGFEPIKINKFLPSLKNLGAAISMGMSYQSPSKIYMTANLKDLGFIRWGKKTNSFSFNDQFKTETANLDEVGNEFIRGFKNIMIRDEEKAIYKTVDGRIDLAASKNFGFYKPVVVLSKSLFRPYGRLGLINNLNHGIFNVSLNPIYDFESKLNIGSQFLVKSPNAEFYIGSEQLFPTYYFTKGYVTKNEKIGKNPTYASLYLGMSIKFGKILKDLSIAEDIEGLNDKESGFTSRLSNKEKKELLKKKGKEGNKRKNTQDKTPKNKKTKDRKKKK